MLFHEANSRQNLSGWHKGEIWPKSVWLTPTNIDSISQKSHAGPKTRNLAQGFWPKNGSRVSRIIFPVSSRGVAILAPSGGTPPGSATIRTSLGERGCCACPATLRCLPRERTLLASPAWAACRARLGCILARERALLAACRARSSCACSSRVGEAWPARASAASRASGRGHLRVRAYASLARESGQPSTRECPALPRERGQPCT